MCVAPSWRVASNAMPVPQRGQGDDNGCLSQRVVHNFMPIQNLDRVGPGNLSERKTEQHDRRREETTHLRSARKRGSRMAGMPSFVRSGPSTIWSSGTLWRVRSNGCRTFLESQPGRKNQECADCQEHRPASVRDITADKPSRGETAAGRVRLWPIHRMNQ